MDSVFPQPFPGYSSGVMRNLIKKFLMVSSVIRAVEFSSNYVIPRGTFRSRCYSALNGIYTSVAEMDIKFKVFTQI